MYNNNNKILYKDPDIEFPVNLPLCEKYEVAYEIINNGEGWKLKNE